MSQTRTYLHTARARLEPGGDPAALGAAVTVGLCGSWDHDGPCLWPHHNETQVSQGVATLRTVFHARVQHEAEVRRLADAALRSGGQAGPDGLTTVWELLDSGPDEPTADEKSLGDRLGGLAGSGG